VWPSTKTLYPRIVPVDPLDLRSGAVAVAIREARLIAVLRRIEPRARLLALVDDLAADGFRIFEITFDGADAAADLAAVRARFAAGPGERAGADPQVGAGTLRTLEQLHAALDAGAAFGVSPVLDHRILQAALAAGLPFIPGVYTPTEADAAWRAGATFVKLFPGSSLGPSHVRELRGPLPELEIIVTGGVDSVNAVAFLAAGAVGVGVGSSLGRMSAAERRTLVAAVRSER
jgi:2-dehydro-3-deoxyphosphogluconate aldolase/(4S)-4-hydroxy-2-oxoglutarate aldolase